MKIKLSKQLFVSLFLLLLSACSTNEVYYEFHSIEASSWNENFVCKFEFPVTDTISVYDIIVEVRNNNNYPYRNLWLFIAFQAPDGNVRKDTLNCELADEFGKWHGKGFSLYTLSFPYEESVRFLHSGTYTYSISQGMRDEHLTGIADIGLKVLKK